MDLWETSSEEDEPEDPVDPQFARFHRSGVVQNPPTMPSTSAPSPVEAGPSTTEASVESPSAAQDSPTDPAPSTSEASIPSHRESVAMQAPLFSYRRLALVTGYLMEKNEPSYTHVEWTEERRSQALPMLYLLCAHLITLTRVVEGVLRFCSLNRTSRLEEVPRLWSYFTGRMQIIQQKAAEVGPPSLASTIVNPSTLLTEQAQNEPTRCKICFQNLPDIMFRPCGHMTCTECSNVLRECPFCKKEIVKRLKAFL